MEMNDNHRHINPEIKEILLQNKREVAFDGTLLEGKPRKYTVINEKDRRCYLSEAENAEFDSLLHYYLGKIQEGRAMDDKEPFNSYLVINTDEPYANEIADVMKRNGHLK